MNKMLLNNECATYLENVPQQIFQFWGTLESTTGTFQCAPKFFASCIRFLMFLGSTLVTLGQLLK